jgi:hypothetical protein
MKGASSQLNLFARKIQFNGTKKIMLCQILQPPLSIYPPAASMQNLLRLNQIQGKVIERHTAKMPNLITPHSEQ